MKPTIDSGVNVAVIKVTFLERHTGLKFINGKRYIKTSQSEDTGEANYVAAKKGKRIC